MNHLIDNAQRHLRIFLVEDNDDTREIVTRILESDGHHVHAVSSVEAALRDFCGCDNDVLVSDIGLSDGSGLELMHALRDRGESPYAIALSGFGSPADKCESAAAGFRHHLVKPFEFDDLDHLLRAVP